MKTTLYIDGYNLYYGVLRNTPYKWLDVVKLFTKITKEHSPASEIIAVKFFTAPVKIRLANHGEYSQKSQRDYHRALELLYPDCVKIIQGFFTLSEGWYPIYETPIDRNKTVRAWNLEEKQTDVNIALNLYRDVSKNGTEQCILISNDSDLTPALQAIKEDFPEVKLGAIMPILHKEEKTRRPPNAGISEFTDWTRGYIRDEELQDSQLPEKIPTKKKPLFKPSYW